MNELVKCEHCGKEYSKMGIGTHIWRNHTETGNLFTANNTNNRNRIYTSSWSKGLTKETSASIRKSAETLKSRFRTGELKYSFLDKIHKKETKKQISESKIKYHYLNGPPDVKFKHFKHGTYKNFKCDSSWELAFVIYNLEHGIKFERNKKAFKYIYKNVTRSYFPDFIIDDIYIEIKGRVSFDVLDEKTKQKIIQFKEPLKVLYTEDMKMYLDYVIEKYGKNFVELYKNKDYKKPIDSDKIIELIKKTNKKFTIEERKNLILNSKIDFSKFGWVNEVSKLTNLLTQKVNSFMKKHLLEFYENKCFKRK